MVGGRCGYGMVGVFRNTTVRSINLYDYYVQTLSDKNEICQAWRWLRGGFVAKPDSLSLSPNTYTNTQKKINVIILSFKELLVL